MAEKLSFKLVLKEEGNEGKDEIKRFVMQKKDKTSLLQVKEKICSVFPQLLQETFTVSWDDEDSDLITIGTDEELDIALEEMHGPLYKLSVLVKRKASIESTLMGSADDRHPGRRRIESISNTSVQSDGAQYLATHYGVTCDACNSKPIKGSRYKCTECNNYDLCGVCKESNHHPRHPFTRIDQPIVTSLFKTSNTNHKNTHKTHHRITCDGCEISPIVGKRYKCVVCDDYDLCEKCRDAGRHPGHQMKLIGEQASKEKKKTESSLHHGITCDSCRASPIIGIRYKCLECEDFDLCSSCKASGRHKSHGMGKIEKPNHFFTFNAIKRQKKAFEVLEKKQKHAEHKLETGTQVTSESSGVSLPSIPECPVCLEDLKPPLRIFNCRNGHLICSVCRPKVDICTNCREEYTGRATAIEQMLRQMFNC